MPVVLSTQDLRRLAALFTAAVDPSRYSTFEALQRDVDQRMGELLGPGRSFPPRLAEELLKAGRWHRVHGRTGLVRHLGKPLALNGSQPMVAERPSAAAGKESYWGEPAPAQEAGSVAGSWDSGTKTGVSDDTVAHLSDHGSGGVAIVDREAAFLQLLLPVLSAAYRAHLAAAETRIQLFDLVDRMKTGSAVYDLQARCEHANPVFQRLLSAEVEPDAIQRGLDSLAFAAALALGGRETAKTPAPTPGQLRRELRTTKARYDLLAVFLGPGMAGNGEGVILITVDKRTLPALSVEALREHHGFTRREAEVARLLALGRSTAQIADALCVSNHTARHHAQAVLSKLGIHRRAAVAAAIQALV